MFRPVPVAYIAPHKLRGIVIADPLLAPGWHYHLQLVRKRIQVKVKAQE